LSDDPFDGKRLDVSHAPVLVRFHSFGGGTEYFWLEGGDKTLVAHYPITIGAKTM